MRHEPLEGGRGTLDRVVVCSFEWEEGWEGGRAGGTPREEDAEWGLGRRASSLSLLLSPSSNLLTLPLPFTRRDSAILAHPARARVDQLPRPRLVCWSAVRRCFCLCSVVFAAFKTEGQAGLGI